MKKTDPAAPLFDFEVCVTTPDQKSETIRIGNSPNPAEACERACAWGKPAGTTAAVLCVLEEHAPKSTTLADLTPSWEPVAGLDGQRFVLRDRQGRIATQEYQGGHLSTAWLFLIGDKAAAGWKTVATLTAFRQAIREEHAACRTDALALLLDGKPTRARVSAFMQGARAHDFAHHGSHTF